MEAFKELNLTHVKYNLDHYENGHDIYQSLIIY